MPLALTPLCVPQAFQRQVHERLTQLELVNKQYRRLARENRTDTASRLKQMVHEGNQRWDGLQRRVTAVLRRLRVTAQPGGAREGGTRQPARHRPQPSDILPFGSSQTCQPFIYKNNFTSIFNTKYYISFYFLFFSIF